MNLDPLTQVVPYLDDPAPARFFLTHERQRQIDHQGGCFHFHNLTTNRWVTQQGLLPVLAAHYWPKYEHPRVPGYREPPKPAASSTMSNGPPSMQSAARGKALGSLVHKQMNDLLTLNAEALQRAYPDGLHDMTKTVYRHLLSDKVQLFPLVGEYKVCDEEMRMASAEDMILCNKRGEIFWTEVKTCKSFRHFCAPASARAPMRGILSKLPNSARNRALVQLAMTMLMGTRAMCYNGPIQGLLLVIARDEPHKVHLIELSKTFLNGTALDVYADIYLARTVHAETVALPAAPGTATTTTEPPANTGREQDEVEEEDVMDWEPS